MKIKLAISLFFLAILFSSCGSLVNGSWKQDLTKRASFELNCEAESLKFTVLKKNPQGTILSYGVTGCNKRAVYLHVDNQWVLNSNMD